MQKFSYSISIYKTKCDKYGFLFYENETMRIVDRTLGNEHFDDLDDLVFWLEDSLIGKFMPVVPLPKKLKV